MAVSLFTLAAHRPLTTVPMSVAAQTRARMENHASQQGAVVLENIALQHAVNKVKLLTNGNGNNGNGNGNGQGASSANPT